MDCAEARQQLVDAQRGRLTPDARVELDSHIAGCSDCGREEQAQAALTAALERLPQRGAPLGLKRRLASRVSATPAVPVRSRRLRFILLAAATFATGITAVTAFRAQADREEALAVARLGDEAVNDHLRLLDGTEPLAIVNSGIHEVKPWFAGKIDFAPVVLFPGDAEYPLRGGAVTHFLDRKAALIVYGRRQHTISLFVFRGDGLDWPTRGLTALGHARAKVATVRGFSTIVWRDGELGYALASDLNAKELGDLGARLAGGPVSETESP